MNTGTSGTNTGDTGGRLVGTQLRPDLFIDLLRTKMAVMNAGATMLSGLVGNISIPKQSSASTAYWVAENSEVTESSPGFTQVTGTPKTCGATLEVTRKLLLQSSIDVENLVRNDLASVVARAIDLAALHGTGASNQPTGITRTSGVNQISIASQGAPTYAEILAFIGAIKADNADVSALKWLMPAGVWETLAGRPKFASTDSQTILNAEAQKMIGYEYVMSNQVSTNDLLFGAWDQLVICLWSGLDVLVNPYANDRTGAVRVTALQDADVMLRYPEAFAYSTDVGGTET
jgi:HK97 family phage major capsid protein